MSGKCCGSLKGIKKFSLGLQYIQFKLMTQRFHKRKSLKTMMTLNQLKRMKRKTLTLVLQVEEMMRALKNYNQMIYQSKFSIQK